MQQHTTPVADRSPPAPILNLDYAFFYEGLAAGQLLVQQCEDCGTLRNPPGPMCPCCRSVKWHGVQVEGAGTVYSYTVHYHPPLPGFDSPHGLALVEMKEGIRLLGGMPAEDLEHVRIGMPVRVEFLLRGDFPTFQFRAA